MGGRFGIVSSVWYQLSGKVLENARIISMFQTLTICGCACVLIICMRIEPCNHGIPLCYGLVLQQLDFNFCSIFVINIAFFLCLNNGNELFNIVMSYWQSHWKCI